MVSTYICKNYKEICWPAKNKKIPLDLSKFPTAFSKICLTAESKLVFASIKLLINLTKVVI